MAARRPTIVTSQSSQETANLGRFLARSLHGGHVIALIGGLGSGKTVLAQALARELGVRRTAKSPTFVLMAGHRTVFRGISWLFHVDCYRIRRLSGTDRAAIMEATDAPRAVTVIEWADRIPSVLAHVPQRRLTTVSFEVVGLRSRRLTIAGALTGSARKWAMARPLRGRADAARRPPR